jgi:thymidylate synthase
MSMYQRSADVALGLPWNITFYGLFLHVMANVCGYNVGTFHHTTGDTHIYYEHTEGLEKQLERHPLEPPEVKVADKDCIDDYEHDDFELIDYKHHPQIDFEIKV